jgi:riboflavin biosynthesis pyrimidine reductase
MAPLTIGARSASGGGRTTGTEDLAPFDLLSEVPGLLAFDLPSALAEIYAGTLGFDTPCLYANFVASVDGVVALADARPSSGSVISGRAAADRFLMGLLRACADAVVIGAGTLRGSPGHEWTPDAVYPSAAREFAELRRRLGRSGSPPLVVVTASGVFDVRHRGLRAGTLVLTGDAGAAELGNRLPDGVTVRSLGDVGELSMARIVDTLHADGHRVILTEGGPTLLGKLLRADLLDELFLTLSPVLFGRTAMEQRKGLVDAVAFTPQTAPWLGLRSVRQNGSYLFLRYRRRTA